MTANMTTINKTTSNIGVWLKFEPLNKEASILKNPRSSNGDKIEAKITIKNEYWNFLFNNLDADNNNKIKLVNIAIGLASFTIENFIQRVTTLRCKRKRN